MGSISLQSAGFRQKGSPYLESSFLSKMSQGRDNKATTQSHSKFLLKSTGEAFYLSYPDDRAGKYPALHLQGSMENTQT